MDIKKQVGKRIALAMELRGWTREEFAARLDVSPTYASKLVRGDQNIGVETLQRIAAVLGQPMSFFVEENYTLNLGYRDEKRPPYITDPAPKKAHSKRGAPKEPARS